MNSLFRKSPCTGYSESRLSSFFFNNTSPIPDDKLRFDDVINSSLVQSGKERKKIGRISLPQEECLKKLRDMNTPQNKTLGHTYESVNNHRHGVTLNSQNQQEMKAFKIPTATFNSSLAFKTQPHEEVCLNSSSILKSTTCNKTVTQNPIIQSSILKKPPSSEQETESSESQIGRLSNNYPIFENSRVLCHKTFRIDNMNEEKEIKEQGETEKIAKLKLELGVPRSRIKIRIWRKKLRNQENIFQKKKKLKKVKRVKKSSPVNIMVEDSGNKNISDYYSYLVERFADCQDSSCNFDNHDLKVQYIQYFTYGKSNEGKLTFGENPLNVFQDYMIHLKKEQEKIPCDNMNCDSTIKTLNQIRVKISTSPVIICPKLQGIVRVKGKLFRKKKSFAKPANAPIKEQNEMPCKFSCSICFESFSSGQGLGGHMSRRHKDQSEKFRMKKEVRDKRVDLRNILKETKQKFCAARHEIYEELCKTRQGKEKLKYMIKTNGEEFNRIRMEIRNRHMDTATVSLTVKRKK